MPAATPKLRIVHLEDRPADAFLIRHVLQTNGIDAEISVVDSEQELRNQIDQGAPNLVLLDSGNPGFSGNAAYELLRQRCPEVPIIFVTGVADQRRAQAAKLGGTTEFVAKGDTPALLESIRRTIRRGPPAETSAPASRSHEKQMRRLVEAVQQLSMARTLDSVMAVVRKAARELTGADGATFVLRDGGHCHYADEDAIAPLWKGKRFPLETCISGWAMLNRRPAIVPDIYVDSRIPIDAYRPTFVKSLVMVPIRTESPVGAIGNYWAQPHMATADEVELLQALANTTAVAIENVRLYEELEQRVQDRTVQLEAANAELEAFSYSVSHDLRSPISVVLSYSQLLAASAKPRLDENETLFLKHIEQETLRMGSLIQDLLRLAQVSRTPLHVAEVDLGELAHEEIRRQQAATPERIVDTLVADTPMVRGDPGLLRIVIENLISNSWKYTSKRTRAAIKFGVTATAEHPRVFFVKDNGAGFDMQFAERLFTPFQRLHRSEEFTGTGVGLATVARIVHKHGGRIWAEAAVDRGATFFFTLGPRAGVP